MADLLKGVPAPEISELLNGARLTHRLAGELRDKLIAHGHAPGATKEAFEAVETLAKVIKELAFVFVMTAEAVEDPKEERDELF